MDETREGVGVGDSIDAIDTGNRVAVYPARGSYTWLILIGLMVAAVVALAGWAWYVARRLSGRRVAVRTG